MCNAAAISMIAQGIGGGISGYGTYKQYSSSAAQQEFEAAQAVQNAQLAKQQQGLVQEAANQQISNIGLSTSQQLGAATAGYAGGNIMVDSGTPLTYRMEAVSQAEREKAATQRQADLDMWKLENERRSLLAQAAMLKRASKDTRSAGKLAAFSSLLGSGSSMIGSYSASKK